MRSLFTFIGLLLVLGVVGVLARKQMTAVQRPIPALQVPADAASGVISPAPGNAPGQSQQLPQHYKQAIEAAMQARPLPDDK